MSLGRLHIRAVPPLALVVEDEPPVRRVTCQYLADGGFECVDAETSAHALELLAKGTLPDLMVLDVRLPDLPGPALALRVHQQHPGLPVLFVSGWIDGLADAETLAPLRWAFLPKPFTGDQLLQAARGLLLPQH
jgi:two-component system cell cycle sensor histidine kinase/response regulator CckA